jgi:hypothetical protein
MQKTADREEMKGSENDMGWEIIMHEWPSQKSDNYTRFTFSKHSGLVAASPLPNVAFDCLHLVEIGDDEF